MYQGCGVGGVGICLGCSMCICWIVVCGCVFGCGVDVSGVGMCAYVRVLCGGSVNVADVL